MIVLNVIRWYLIAGLTQCVFHEYFERDFLEELFNDVKHDRPGFTNFSYWAVIYIVTIAIWPYITFWQLRGFFASCYRSLIDIFSKKGANNETYGKNQEDTGKE